MTDARARLEAPDLSEKGGLKGGQPQRSDERLFMQLLVYTGCDNVRGVAEWIGQAPIDSVVYERPQRSPGRRDPDGRTRPEHRFSMSSGRSSSRDQRRPSRSGPN